MKKAKQKQKKGTIYDLDLHETLCTKLGIVIMRVASGWIYDCWDTKTDSFKTGIFVPFGNRFQTIRRNKMKQEFKMTQQEMDDIIAINENRMPLMKIGNVSTGMDLQARVNNYWKGLSDKYGFKRITVEPSSKGKLFFLAEPKSCDVLKAKTETNVDIISALAKKIDKDFKALIKVLKSLEE